MKFILNLILALICGAGYANAADISYFTGVVPDGYNYVLSSPDSRSSDLTPLIIALHSRGASGNNLRDVDFFGTIDAIESGLKIDAFVLAPQATGDVWDVDKVLKTVDHVLATNPIDSNRIYAIGMSMGGNGVADLIAAYPDKIAAAIILAGGTSPDKGVEMSKVPLWVIRGLDDRSEAISRTDNMVDGICMADGSRVVYTLIKGLGHRQHERLLYMPDFYDWLMSHSLAEPNRPVHTANDIKTKNLKNAYKGLKLREGSAAKRPGGLQGGRGPSGLRDRRGPRGIHGTTGPRRR